MVKVKPRYLFTDNNISTHPASLTLVRVLGQVDVFELCRLCNND